MPLLFRIFLLFSLLAFSACNAQNDTSALSNDEKINLRIEGDTQLSDDEIEQQKSIRKAILEQVQIGQNSLDTIQAQLDNAQNLLPESDYNAILRDQEQWQKTKKGDEINEYIRNGLPPAEAFAATNKKRAQNIERLTSKYMLSHYTDGFPGFYSTKDGRELEIYELPQKRLNLVFRETENDFILTATGTHDDKAATLCSEVDPHTCIIITQPDREKILIQSHTTHESNSGNMVHIPDGTYYRFHNKNSENE